jgi:hypothetical protein
VAITAWAVFEPLGGIGFTLAPLFGEDLIRGRRIIGEFFDPELGVPRPHLGHRSSRRS